MIPSLALLAAVLVLLAGDGRPPARRPGAAPPAAPADHLAALGRTLRRWCGRPAEPAADRWWGISAAAGVVAAVVDPRLGLLVAGAGPAAVWAAARARRQREWTQRRHALPEVLELVAVALRAGGTVPAALALVAQRGPAPAAPAFAATLADASAGRGLAGALDTLPGRLGEPYRPLAAALLSAVRDGAPLAALVDQLAADAHDARRRLAEARARQVPVRLLLPLVCCTLPAVVVVTVVPLVLVGAGVSG
jgi:tight adherence protein C